MPWIAVGANLSITIVMYMFAKGYYDHKDEILFQWDGASDNVNRYIVYFFCWVLLGAQRAGASLERVELNRLYVGHTHNDVDQAFSVLFRVIYGCIRWGMERMNIFSLAAFERWESPPLLFLCLCWCVCVSFLFTSAVVVCHKSHMRN